MRGVVTITYCKQDTCPAMTRAVCVLEFCQGVKGQGYVGLCWCMLAAKVGA